MAEDGDQQSVALDVAPLLQALPADIHRHLAAILQTYQRPTAASARQSPRDTEQDDDPDIESDYLDDDSAGREDDSKTLARPAVDAVDAEPSYSSSEEVTAESSPASNWVVGRDRPWPALRRRPPTRKRLTGAYTDRSTSYYDVQDEDYDDSREGSDEQREDSGEDSLSEVKPDNLLETSLSPEDRLALWRYWKETQQSQDKVPEKSKRRKKGNKRKNVGRSQKEMSSFLRQNDFREERNGQSIPKNHRIE